LKTILYIKNTNKKAYMRTITKLLPTNDINNESYGPGIDRSS
jgi:hypothetical protein